MFVLYQGERERKSSRHFGPEIKTSSVRPRLTIAFHSKAVIWENHFARIGTISISPDFWGNFESDFVAVGFLNVV